MHKTCQERYRTAGSHQAQLLYPPLLGVRLPLLASRQLFIVQIHDYCPHMSMAMFLSHNGKHEAKQGLLGHVQSGDPEIHHIYPRLPRSTSVLGACSFQRLLFLLIICHSVGMSLISSPLQGRHQKDQSRCPGIHFLCASASLRLTQTAGSKCPGPPFLTEFSSSGHSSGYRLRTPQPSPQIHVHHPEMRPLPAGTSVPA